MLRYYAIFFTLTLLAGCATTGDGRFLVKSLQNDLLFPVDSAQVLTAASMQLDEVAMILRNSDKEILIEGHADASGDDMYNLRLSEKRALSVRQSLIERGISPARIFTVGYGESKPIASNATVNGKRLNRRVEIYYR